MKRVLLALLFVCVYSGVAFTEEPEQQFSGFNLQGYDEAGEKSWEVNGDTADIVGSEIILSNVDANTFGEQGMNVVSKTGVVDRTSGKMHLEENVVITSGDGQKLMTDSLDWNRTEDLVTTDEDVMIRGEKMTATGTGMRAKPGFKTAKLNKDVTVIFDTDSKNDSELKNTEPGKTVTITSDGPMVIDQLESVGIFEDNVVAFQDDQTLKADRMEIHFDKEMSGIQEMICIGNVEIEQGENKSYAQKAVYSGITKKLTLSGRPKLIMQTEGGSLFAASGN